MKTLQQYRESNGFSTFITVKRTIGNSTENSSLLIKDDHLEVVGVLPHNALLTFDRNEAAKLKHWLSETYGV